MVYCNFLCMVYTCLATKYMCVGGTFPLSISHFSRYLAK